jgi:hypothetical protein
LSDNKHLQIVIPELFLKKGFRDLAIFNKQKAVFLE